MDFHREETTSTAAHYIGLHSFRDPDTREVLVHDWRAPVSSLFYDFETGPAEYAAPSGVERGEITGKRQYKIDDGQMRFMLESTLSIGDDVLQEELSRGADDKMRNIVATIQREQNAVIRNEDAEVLILQGVAGSNPVSPTRKSRKLTGFRDFFRLFADEGVEAAPSGRGVAVSG
ncbi:hypothetical protein Q7C18_12120 [Nesterenkonia sp. CL21]|uniref:hypothetical protein n=1 Tax=Nesterenkonia sp. CL21 TaxID=3064894 RepID=UPI0028799C1D|nr:hypothetical protein [Nesterenkonia sp. CL21]MDS2173447.1 hypothetical protein [Nesterenkonia sp. CL21]